MNPLEGVTLDRLFRPQKTIDLAGKTVTVRALSDPEHSDRYKLAMLVRTNLSEQLADPKSDEYIARFGNLDEATQEDMVASVLTFRAKAMQAEAEKRFPYEFTPIPDNATNEETEATFKQRKKSVAQTEANRAKYLAKVVDEAKETLSQKPREELDAEYKKSLRERALEVAYMNEMVAQTIHFGTNGLYSAEDARALHTTIKEKLWAAVMEVDNIDPLRLSGPASTAGSTEPTA